ncbi:MAG: hypothetical protein ACK4P1_00815 [Aggregatilineales bacterium]
MLLTAVLVVPIAAALFMLLALKDQQKTEVRLLAAFSTGVCLVLSFLVYIEASTPAALAAAAERGARGLSYFVQ